MAGSSTGRSIRVICGLVGLHIFGSALGSAAGHRAPSLVSSWISGDFDGNRTVDVALSSTVAHDRSGYAQEVRVNLGASSPSLFGFHSRSAKIQLGVRDIDGDLDLDIVVLDGLSMVPIGIWLNDGVGNFSEGDLSRYQGAPDTGNSTSLKAPQTAVDRLFAVIAQNSPPALLLICTAEPERTVQGCAPPASGGHPAHRPVRLRSRAPPCNS